MCTCVYMCMCDVCDVCGVSVLFNVRDDDDDLYMHVCIDVMMYVCTCVMFAICVVFVVCALCVISVG